MGTAETPIWWVPAFLPGRNRIAKLNSQLYLVARIRKVELYLHSPQWRTEGGFGVFKHPPGRNSEGPPKLCQTQPDL